MAIVNSNYEFILCDVGTNGRVSDGGVIANTSFYKKLVNKKLSIPDDNKVAQNDRMLPFVFIGDEAFSLREDFLKPFSSKDQNPEREVFNYRLSRARRIVENGFGILASRFRIFHTPINIHPDRVTALVMACCTLHNFLRRNCNNCYTPPGVFDVENFETGTVTFGKRTNPDTFSSLSHGQNRNSDISAKSVRDNFMDYFNNEGKVSWQEMMIRRGNQ